MVLTTAELECAFEWCRMHGFPYPTTERRDKGEAQDESSSRSKSSASNEPTFETMRTRKTC